MDKCNKHLSLKERELQILRASIDAADELQSRRLANDPNVKRMVKIVEDYLRKRKLICYGGTAINNILPVEDQFYDRNLQIPDYDFFSKSPVEDAKRLADIYAKEGFGNVVAKAGVHYGTYKVFVDFTPIADITYVPKKLFDNIQKDSITVNGILYAPPDYLRMAMYLELSRPAGDVSRWEKVLKRLILLNKNYPLETESCDPRMFQRELEDDDDSRSARLYHLTRQAFIDQGLVFFGGYASFLFSKHMPKHVSKRFSKQPDFDVLSEEPVESATILQERLEYAGFRQVKQHHHKAIGEIIPEHIEVRVGKETVAFIYKPIGCHSYNLIDIDKKKVKVASIDTILSLYLAFLYADRDYYDKKRILCMATFLFDVQKRNRLSQEGILKRFPIECYGEQHTIDDIRQLKSDMYAKLHDKKTSKEYEEWFLNYQPTEEESSKEEDKEKKAKEKSSKGKKSGGAKLRHTRKAASAMRSRKTRKH